MHADLESILWEFGGDPAICLREEAICAKVYRRKDGRTDDRRRAIALAHSWNELMNNVRVILHSKPIYHAIFFFVFVGFINNPFMINNPFTSMFRRSYYTETETAALHNRKREQELEVRSKWLFRTWTSSHYDQVRGRAVGARTVSRAVPWVWIECYD